MIFQHSTTLNAKIITCLASSLFGGGKGGGGGGGGGELEAAKHALSSILLHTLPLIHAQTKPQATQATKNIISRQTLNVLLPGRLT